MKSKINQTNLLMVGIVLIGLISTAGCDSIAVITPTSEFQSLDAANEIIAADGAGTTSLAAVSDEIIVTTVGESGTTIIDKDVLEDTLGSMPTGELNQAEIEGLLYMREEEKLARDVYLRLWETWGLPIFQNISQSEETHMEAIRVILERYGLEDPAAATGVGVFTNPTLQSLYDQLVAQGSQSLQDALKVGLAVEEIDILDLEEYLAQTNKSDIIMVYNNLLKGSRNHLRSFVATFELQAGETYQPQYLSQEVYDAIVSSAIERGNQGNLQGGNGRNGNPNRGKP
ncbi:MAG: DUF2202 domain-containing protein [Anaerolineaceae bacterium]|nr:DUF2202 domain-containing protein [Anaerolineaceae bacterium]